MLVISHTCYIIFCSWCLTFYPIYYWLDHYFVKCLKGRFTSRYQIKRYQLYHSIFFLWYRYINHTYCIKHDLDPLLALNNGNLIHGSHRMWNIASVCLSCYIPLRSFGEAVYHIFGVWYETLLKGCYILLKCSLIVVHGSQTDSLWLWKEGESDHLGGRPNWKQGLLNGAQKISIIVSAVVIGWRL